MWIPGALRQLSLICEPLINDRPYLKRQRQILRENNTQGCPLASTCMYVHAYLHICVFTCLYIDVHPEQKWIGYIFLHLFIQICVEGQGQPRESVLFFHLVGSEVKLKSTGATAVSLAAEPYCQCPSNIIFMEMFFHHHIKSNYTTIFILLLT